MRRTAALAVLCARCVSVAKLEELMKLFDRLTFSAEGLVPAVIQNKDGQVLTLCYMTREAVEQSLATGKIHVFRRSKGRLMMKGESSGHVQEVRELRIDCEGRSLLFKVRQHVAGCHRGYMSCYFERYDAGADRFEIVEDRVFDPDEVY